MLTLQIVCFDYPAPPNYGGVIDMYYKIKQLHEAGVKIILHCIYKNRLPNNDIETYCDKIYYYKRKSLFISALHYLPLIVCSRKVSSLLSNLCISKAPILFEGLHTCAFISYKELKQHKKIVRMHNVEHDYYYELFRKEKNIFKKIYYIIESIKLKKFERILNHSNTILAINTLDYNHFKQEYPNQECITLLPFHEFNNSRINTLHNVNDKPFVLFHGNMGVAENENAALFFLKNIFPYINAKGIIAGSNMNVKLLGKYLNRNAEIIPNPNEKVLNELISTANVNVCYTEQGTGVKLKLIHCLYKGGHCIANETMLYGLDKTKLKSIDLAETKEGWIEKINKMLTKPFTNEDEAIRQKDLQYFENTSAIKNIISCIT